MNYNSLKTSKFYKIWFKDAFPYVTGAILLSVFQIATLATTGNPWGVTGPFSYWGAWVIQLFGADVTSWHFFSTQTSQDILAGGFLNHPESLRNVAVIFGALFSTLMASQFKIKKLKNVKQIIAAILGGLLMGYGARLAYGCNIGAFYSGIASFSLSGWVFGLSLFFGAIMGSKLLAKYFM
jgi:uncharacterized membrane protein YedE/YeeE